MADGSCNIPQPQCFKDLMNLISKIHRTDAIRKTIYDSLSIYIIQEIYEEVEDLSYESDEEAVEAITEMVSLLNSHVDEFRRYILKDSDSPESFGIYQDLCADGSHTLCTKEITDLFIKSYYPEPTQLKLIFYMWVRGLRKEDGEPVAPELVSKMPNINMKDWLTDKCDKVEYNMPCGFTEDELAEDLHFDDFYFNAYMKTIVDDPIKVIESGTLFEHQCTQAVDIYNILAFLDSFCTEVTKGEDSVFKDEVKNYTLPDSDLVSTCKHVNENITDIKRTTLDLLNSYTIDPPTPEKGETEQEESKNKKRLEERSKRANRMAKLKYEDLPKYVDWMKVNLEFTAHKFNRLTILVPYKLGSEDDAANVQIKKSYEDAHGYFKYSLEKLVPYYAKMFSKSDPGSIRKVLECFVVKPKSYDPTSTQPQQRKTMQLDKSPSIFGILPMDVAGLAPSRNGGVSEKSPSKVSLGGGASDLVEPPKGDDFKGLSTSRGSVFDEDITAEGGVFGPLDTTGADAFKHVEASGGDAFRHVTSHEETVTHKSLSGGKKFTFKATGRKTERIPSYGSDISIMPLVMLFWFFLCKIF
ncbi:hypothetical protein BgAZ_107090 [Babesia gibsoni]|uniref:Uncharacterized protein n=1 Tax=Babesia gibsoni TaxID=33632 RepID=A0AAD8PG33_BABGI|nr:hypothetical protein BgAZ_107090 [Babesia gibsoni]